MTLVLAWVLFPLLFAALSLGCGLFLQRLTGRELPGTLLLPAGFAVIVVVATYMTSWSSSARFTTPLLVVLALAGFALSRSFRPRLSRWTTVAAVGVFAIYAAPIVLSGAATFAGYLTLDDTATWLAFADNAMYHGRSLATLAPSSYEVTLHDYLDAGYPIGAFLSLGIGHELSRQDGAWLFQPLIAFLGAMLSLSIYTLTSGVIRRAPLRAFVAFIAAQPTLLYGYAYWSGLKEMTAAALISLIAALVVFTLQKPWSVRQIVPVTVAGAALLSCLSLGGGIWFAGFLLLPVLLIATHGLKRTGISLLVLFPLGLVLTIPMIRIATVFLNGFTGTGEISSSGNLANLLHRLSYFQIFGIWLVGDFRQRPTDMSVTFILIGVLAAAAATGLVVSLRRRQWAVPLYTLVAVGGAFTIICFDYSGDGSPWLDGKGLATGSPGLLVAGGVGVAVIFEAGRRIEGVVLAAVIAGAVLWSNAYAYGNVWLAPHGQFSELAAIGNQFAGDGPSLMTEFQPYGVRHFLRRLDPEGASERRYRPVFLRNGGLVEKLQYADLDDFALGGILVYRTIVLRTSPLESRPPSIYHLVKDGRWYEVWQRPVSAPTILEHLSLGNDQQPVGVAPCADIHRLATLAASQHGKLVASLRAAAESYPLAQSVHPSNWSALDDGTLLPHGGGRVDLSISVPDNGVGGFWLNGSFRGRMELFVDGQKVGSATNQLNEIGQLTPLGAIPLTAGTHSVELRYGGPSLRPGSRGYSFSFGPLYIGLSAPNARLITVSPSKAGTLCGQSYDWIEAVAG